MATLTLSQRANLDHTSDDFTVGQQVKAHPATDTFMRGDVYGRVDHISRGPTRFVRVKMDRSGRRFQFAARNLLHVGE